MYAANDEAIPKDKVDLYLRVLALSEKGEPGEKDQAARTLAKLRLKYPGIEDLAEEALGAAKRANRSEAKPPPGPGPKEAFWSTYTRTYESVTRILDEIHAVLSDVTARNEATDALDEVMDAQVKTVKVRGVEKFRLLLDLDAEVLADVLESIGDDENAVRAVTTHIGTRVAESLADVLLGATDEDDDEDE
jgi:hypothetical protein